MFVWKTSSEPRNILLPNLVLWCILVNQIVMQKKWFAFFKVKVTAGDHMIKIWLFLQYVLNCWSFYKQTCFYGIMSQTVLWKKWIAEFKVQVTAKLHNVDECLSTWYLLNHWTVYITNFVWWRITIGQSVVWKGWFADFTENVKVEAHIIEIGLPSVSSEVLILLQSNLFLWCYESDCLVKRMDCWVRSQGHSKTSQCRWMFVHMISSEPLNCLYHQLCMVTHHYWPECHVKRLVCWFHWECQSGGPYNWNRTS